MARVLHLLTYSLVMLLNVAACSSAVEDCKSELSEEVSALISDAAHDLKNQDFESAMESALRALDTSRTCGYPLGEVQALHMITGIDIMSSRDSDAWEKALEAEAIARRHGFSKELSQMPSYVLMRRFRRRPDETMKDLPMHRKL